MDDAGFPLAVGCLDVGSNGVRSAIARFADRDHYDVVEYQRYPIRLGHDVFLTGRLSPAAMDAAIAAFRTFQERMDHHRVTRFRAVATSAVREAVNGPEFLLRVEQETGFVLHCITGSEEARLVFLAASHRVPLRDHLWLLVDLGGGSVEISLVDQKGIRWTESHTMGSVRLLEELTQSGEDPGRFLRLLEEYASTLRLPRAKGEGTIGYIATGGNIESLARLSGRAPDATGVASLPMSELRRRIEQLARLSYRQRIDDLGLRPDRADVILPAAIIYERLGQLLQAQAIVVPHVGVKDGILLDLANDQNPGDLETLLDRQLEEAALSLGRKYQFDEAHAQRVARLALSLFDQTNALHGLDRSSRRILLAAALLHEIGSFISQAGHHRHSYYLIAASSLPGLDAAEIELVANVARYHRKSVPKPDHEAYQRLSKPDRLRVDRLSALLRVADALDRDHAQHIGEVTVKIDKQAVRLFVDAPGDLLLERWSLHKRSDLFRQAFERKISLEKGKGDAEGSRS